MESESVMPPADSPVSSSPAGLESFDWVSLLQEARQYKAAIVLLTPAITIFLWFFVSYQTSPLKKYPGPFLAGSCNPSTWFQVSGCASRPILSGRVVPTARSPTPLAPRFNLFV